MPRCVVIILMVATLTGCDRYSHTLYWPGVSASGRSWSGYAASYTGVHWRVDPGPWVSEENKALGEAPGFSVRLPDGTVLTPDQFTVELLGREAAPYEGVRIIGDVSNNARFTYPNGVLSTSFDESNRLKQMSAEAMDMRSSDASDFGDAEGQNQPGSDIAIGNRDGTKLVVLPATRAELEAVFGEPVLAKHHSVEGSNPLYWPGVHAFKSHRAQASAAYDVVDWSPLPTAESSEKDKILGHAPGFSVRLPDSSVLTPDQFTVELLHARETLPQGGGIEANFAYPNGRLDAYFDDRSSQLTRISVSEGRTRPGAGSDVAIGNRDGTKLVALPATRRELVALFGKPTLEEKRQTPWDTDPSGSLIGGLLFGLLFVAASVAGLAFLGYRVMKRLSPSKTREVPVEADREQWNEEPQATWPEDVQPTVEAYEQDDSSVEPGVLLPTGRRLRLPTLFDFTDKQPWVRKAVSMWTLLCGAALAFLGMVVLSYAGSGWFAVIAVSPLALLVAGAWFVGVKLFMHAGRR